MSRDAARGARDATSRSDCLVVFDHIPKTAGTSFLKVLEANYAPHRRLFCYDKQHLEVDRIRKGQRSLDDLDCVSLHGASLILPRIDRPTRVLTFVREPVKRLLSLYYYLLTKPHRDQPGDLVADKIRGAGLSLADLMVTQGQKQPPDRGFGMFFNGQARTLLGTVGLGSLVPFGEISEEQAEAAVAQASPALEAMYSFGVTEAFDDSVRKFASELGWSEVSFPRERVTKRPRGSDVSDEDRETIRRFNRVDEKLWQWATSQLGR